MSQIFIGIFINTRKRLHEKMIENMKLHRIPITEINRIKECRNSQQLFRIKQTLIRAFIR